MFRLTAGLPEDSTDDAELASRLLDYTNRVSVVRRTLIADFSGWDAACCALADLIVSSQLASARWVNLNKV